MNRMKNWSAAVCMMLFPYFALLAAEPDRALLQELETALAAGDAEKAETLIPRVAPDPNSSEARLYLVRTELARGNPSAAVRICMDIAKDPASSERDIVRASLAALRLCEESGDTDGIREIASVASARLYGDARARYAFLMALGRVYECESKRADARSVYESAARTSSLPRYLTMRAESGLARLLLAAEKYREAMTAFQRLADEPELEEKGRLEARLNEIFASRLFMAARPREAAKDPRVAERAEAFKSLANSDKAAIAGRLAEFFLGLKNPERAFQEYQNMYAFLPHTPGEQFSIAEKQARIREKQNRVGEAAQLYRRFLNDRRAPLELRIRALFGLCDLLERAGKAADAESECVLALKRIHDMGPVPRKRIRARAEAAEKRADEWKARNGKESTGGPAAVHPREP